MTCDYFLWLASPLWCWISLAVKGSFSSEGRRCSRTLDLERCRNEQTCRQESICMADRIQSYHCGSCSCAGRTGLELELTLQWDYARAAFSPPAYRRCILMWYKMLLLFRSEDFTLLRPLWHSGSDQGREEVQRSSLALLPLSKWLQPQRRGHQALQDSFPKSTDNISNIHHSGWLFWTQMLCALCWQ